MCLHRFQSKSTYTSDGSEPKLGNNLWHGFDSSTDDKPKFEQEWQEMKIKLRLIQKNMQRSAFTGLPFFNSALFYFRNQYAPPTICSLRSVLNICSHSHFSEVGDLLGEHQAKNV